MKTNSLKLKYKFKNEALLEEALKHKSFSPDINNERLEFLGDSILNFIIAEKLIQLFPNMSEGDLSKKRAYLVNINMLAKLSKVFDFENFMKFGPGEIKQGSHINPRIQGSCLEALIGAIYLDSDLATVRNWLLELYSEDDFAVSVEGSFVTDYKTRLQEWLQKKGIEVPAYELVLSSGPSHKPMFLVSIKINGIEKARASGSSKKIAEQAAAEICYNQLMKDGV
jgi:ribonuclease III